MTDSKAVMQQALDALIESVDLVTNEYIEAVELYSNYPSRLHRLTALKTALDAHNTSIDTLRAAIAQPVQPTDNDFDRALRKHETNCCMFERGVQTLDDVLRSREVFIKFAQSKAQP